MTAIAEHIVPARLAAAPSGVGWVDRLLRDRASLVAAIESGEHLGSLARAMVVTILIAGGAFGAALGTYRGGWQVAFAAVKLPLVLLLTACVCAPLLTAVRRAVTRRGDLRRDVALVLASLALASLLQAALTPIFILSMRFGANYHELIVIAAAIYGAGGLLGLSMLRGGQRARREAGGWIVTALTVVVFLTVAAQMAWVLRPYLVRPRTPQPPIVRALEGSAFDIGISMRSALGIYDDPNRYDDGND